jgi:hypothetical protein
VSQDKPVVRIFTIPQEFPCGEKATCCGSIGQSEEQIAALESSIAQLGTAVEVLNVKKMEVLQKHPIVFKLLRTFGKGVVPILTVGDQIVGMGFPTLEQAVKAVEERLVGA